MDINNLKRMKLPGDPLTSSLVSSWSWHFWFYSEMSWPLDGLFYHWIADSLGFSCPLIVWSIFLPLTWAEHWTICLPSCSCRPVTPHGELSWPGTSLIHSHKISVFSSSNSINTEIDFLFLCYSVTMCSGFLLKCQSNVCKWKFIN